MPRVVTLNELLESSRPSDRAPVVFLGHGSPMNAIEDTAHAQGWRRLGAALPRPQAVLCVSAHWMTRGGTLVDVSEAPRTIHDFGGFPDELYRVKYPAPGAPALAQEVAAMLGDHNAHPDATWGLDHGAWSVLNHLYPDADVRVFQVSIDMAQPFERHLEIGRALKTLRDRGVLVLGSGNLVHNLGAMRMDGHVHDWALEFDALARDWFANRDFGALTAARDLGPLMRMAHPTPDHFIPAVYCAGLVDDADELAFFNEGVELGGISMRSFIYA